MKKFLFIVGLAAILVPNSYSQIMQASIGVGSAPTRVKLYVRPTSAVVNGTLSTLQFDVAVLTSVTPVPTLTVLSTAFGTPGAWQVDPPYVEDGYLHYQITSGSIFTNVNIGASVEVEAMEVDFAGGPVTPQDVALVTLGFGGMLTGNALFLCTGAATSVEGQLYYPRSGVIVQNLLSYTNQLISYATIGGILLPVKWISFDAVMRNSDAVLNWVVSNEDANHHYDVQRSLNGSDFVTIGAVNKNAAGNGVHSYEYTDQNITNLGSPVLHYRLKQVDQDNNFSLSDIRTVRLDIKGQGITIFPNPVKDGFYVNIPFTDPDQRPVKLVLRNTAGQLIQTKTITTSQASNYYFDIKDLILASGQYYLQIQFEGQVLDNRKLFINKD